MNENRRRVLEMTAEGKLSAEEAERLLSALDEEREPDSGGFAPVPPGDAKYLRIVVEPGPEVAPEGDHVNIRVPLALLRAGIRLSALLPEETANGINEALRSMGLDFDVHNIKPDAVDELIAGLTGFEIDVQEPAERVRIYTE